MNRIAYRTTRLFTGDEWKEDHAVIVEDGFVIEVLPFSEVQEMEVRDAGDVMAPAFIDLQIYGANKKLLAEYPSPDALQDLVDYCRDGGAVLCLPTLATNTREIFFRAIDAVRDYWKQGGKGVPGLHLEGPWINPVKRGAHVEALIHSPGIEKVRELLEYGKGAIKMITLAPEVCSSEVIRLIQSYNIILSAGHSNCSYEDAVKSFDEGIGAVTHLYNAMSPLQHREPGLVGAALHHDSVRASIIADGHHVRYEAIAIAKKIMGNRLFAITDAVTETVTGAYRHEPEGDKYVCNGTLSGSALTMHKAFTNLVRFAGIDEGEALRMCSLYPAKVAQLEGYGKIAPGYAAEFVVMNNGLELTAVISG